MVNPLIIKKEKSRGVELPKSAGMLDDFAVRKSVQTKEIEIQKSNSNVMITNLNADLLDGNHAAAFQVAGSYEPANANIQTHVTGTGSPHTWAGINKTVSDISDITTKSHTSLTDIGTNTHAQIDTAITNSVNHIADNTQAHSDYMLNTGDTATGNYTFDTNTLFLDATSNRVGIGTTSPKGKLHIMSADGSIFQPGAGADQLVIENNGNAGMTISGPDANAQSIRFGSASTDVYASISSSFNSGLLSIATSRATGAIAFSTGIGSEAVRILTNGNVGIGTTNPTGDSRAVEIMGPASGDASLKISGGGLPTGTNAFLYLNAVGGNSYINGVGSGNLYLGNNGRASTAVTILSDGNVGIGDTAPGEKLDVTGNINATGVIKIDDVQVISNQVAAIGLNAKSDADKITDIITALRSHGILGPNA